VLGLSVTLVKDWAPKADRDFYHYPDVPATSTYDAVTGGWAMLVALIGFASLFVEFLQGIIMMAFDTLAALLFVAGGIATAIGLHGISCNDGVELVRNGLVNGGCHNADKWPDHPSEVNCYYFTDGDKIVSRCKMNQADTAFMFLGFAVCAGLVAHTFLIGGRSTGRRSVV
jgi:hypothetical protein